MDVVLSERGKKSSYTKFSVNVVEILPVQDLYVVLTFLKKILAVGKNFNPEVLTSEYNQLSFFKVQHIINGITDTGVDIQLASVIVSEHLTYIMTRSNSVDFDLKYYSDLPFNDPNRKYHEPIVRLIDYKGYFDLVTLMGNTPMSFKEFVLKTLYNEDDDELDYDLHNHTSYFNFRGSSNKELLTYKGMRVYIEEIVDEFYKTKGE